MIRKYLANRRIKKFLMSMPRTLAHDYGRSDEYTSGQVKTAAKKLGYSDRELQEIAVSIYCNKEAAKAFGIDDALVKKYRGYPERHRVTMDQAVGGGGFDISSGSD